MSNESFAFLALYMEDAEDMITEDNIGGMIIEASKMITESASKSESEPEEVPEHLREKPF